jgi:hypothetical protein
MPLICVASLMVDASLQGKHSLIVYDGYALCPSVLPARLTPTRPEQTLARCCRDL